MTILIVCKTTIIIRKNDPKQNQQDIELKNINYFHPKQNICYCYFIEKEGEQTISGLNYAVDIQRFCSLPSSSIKYTFLGFPSSKVTREMIQIIQEQNVVEQNEIKIYCYEGKEDMNYFKDFIPNENLNYFYFKEKKPTNFEELENMIKEINELKNIIDIQRFHYHIGKQQIYSFFGFNINNEHDEEENQEKIDLNNEHNKTKEKTPTTEEILQRLTQLKVMNEDQDIFFMHFKEPTPTINLKSNSNDNKEQHQEIQSSQEKDKEEDKEEEINDYIQLFPNEYVIQKFDFTIENKNQSDSIFKCFVPRMNVFYLFFVEYLTPNEKIINRKYTNIYSITNSVDIQRFRYYPRTKEIYTFIGFSNEQEMKKSLNNKELISNSVNKIIYTYPYKKITLI